MYTVQVQVRDMLEYKVLTYLMGKELPSTHVLLDLTDGSMRSGADGHGYPHNWWRTILDLVPAADTPMMIIKVKNILENWAEVCSHRVAYQRGLKRVLHEDYGIPKDLAIMLTKDHWTYGRYLICVLEGRLEGVY